jgi:hypothetical protein
MSFPKWISGIVVVVIVGAVIFFIYSKSLPQTGRQAVFLTNGQVYFGHLTKTDSNFLTLEDVYYLQEQQGLLQSGQGSNNKVNVIKLGAELHAPEDKMSINREHVLFYETMKPDSRINQAIEQFVKTGPTPAAK